MKLKRGDIIKYYNDLGIVTDGPKNVNRRFGYPSGKMIRFRIMKGKYHEWTKGDRGTRIAILSEH